jgi:hypothetical protein
MTGPEPRRFDYCRADCTADCGHCKGRPVEALREALNLMRDELATEKHGRRVNEAHLLGLLGAMRPVVEAAEAWRERSSSATPEPLAEGHDVPGVFVHNDLIAAVDAYRAVSP